MQTPEYFKQAATRLGMNEREQNAALQDFLTTGGANLNPEETAWCAAFVNASLAHGGAKGTGSLAARSFLNWGSPVTDPQVGDVAVFSRPSGGPSAGHVGFYAGLSPDGQIRVLGGNQGDAVSYANYPPDRLLGYRRAPAPDVRMASNDMTQPVPTGDPVTGRMDMPQGSLPPEMGGGPSVLTGDLLKQALIQAAQPVKPSPYAAMGATLGAMGDLFALPQYRTGALQRLQEMTSPGYQQAMAQKDQAQQLYWTQLALQLNRDLGGVKMSPLEQQRAAIDWARLQQDQAELQARKEGAYNTGEPPTPRLVNVFDQGGTFLGQKSVLPGETPDPGTSWGNMGQGFQGTPPAKAEEANPYAGQLEQLESLIGDLEQNPAMQNALGTSGSLGAKISAVAGLFDQVFGTQVNTGFKAAFGGEDPAIVQGRLRGVVLPVARLLVEPKGPLSRDEQAQARLLLGVMEDGKLLSADQAFRLLKLTNKAVRKAAGLPVEDGGSTGSLPPQVDEVLPTTPGAREIQTEDGRTFRIYQ